MINAPDLDTPQPTSNADARIRLFGIDIDVVCMSQAVDRIQGWVAQGDGRCRYVVTPNVDHAVIYQSRADLRSAYSQASLVLADGAPLVAASRLLGRPLPERVAGSDLIPAMFDAATSETPLRVFLLGAAPGVGSEAARQIAHRWPHVKIVGVDSPPLGFEHDDAENERILAQIAAARPDVLVIGFGAPKQELWVHRHADRIDARVAVCAGATIDFLAGERRRSPRWMRKVGLEWLHRVACEPRRLAGRYLRDGLIFPRLLWRELRIGRRVG